MNAVIIGGGAAGISLAIEAARENPQAKVEIIEKNNSLGKKLLATGNGKCNISNINGEDITSVLMLFESIGLMIRKEDEGRLYPYSEQASAVVEAFEREIDRLGIKKRLNTDVERIEKAKNGFKIILKRGEPVFADRVAVTTGGKAAPQFGTTGDGYRFAKNLGHSITKLAPTLMPIICEGEFDVIKGVRAKGTATLLKKGNPLAIEKGEIQFTNQGLSGICIFNLSRLLKIEEGVKLEDGFREYSIVLDFVPETSVQMLTDYLLQKQKKMPDEMASVILQSILNNKLASFVYERSLSGKDRKVSQITAHEMEKLSQTVKALTFTVTGGKGWKEAQCTSGGVASEEINMNTMESKLVKGLFFGGEIIDYDGPCGGYNLQNAWLNGIKAGHNIVKEI
ncbi:MAG: aminoacetone oxidase family FAD-binding enzyme [Peptostreptococcaceae bacterium]|nr:aminoacetone oxidase family FAD-binding enzyme [Peptostreptococcaceae bacterium]